MATYKVLQDIEAEDKLIGPLTLRQCIYAAIAVLAGYLSFLAISKHVAVLVIIFLPFMIFGGFFAFPWSRQQPTEVWALAKIRFFLKPRKRIWNQSGVKELVTITVPKQLERIYTNGLTQTEVKSRLQALANTIDTRGWAVKNVDVASYAQANAYGMAVESDRLVDASSLPQEVSPSDVASAMDMLDPNSSPVARQFDSLISASSIAHRQKLVNQLNQSVLPAPIAPTPNPAASTGAPAADYWFMDQPAADSTAPTGTADEAGLAASLKARARSNIARPFAHLRTVNPLQNQTQPMPQSPLPPVTTTPTPATLELASNNDLNVATIAREAQRRNPELPDEEVTISLR